MHWCVYVKKSNNNKQLIWNQEKSGFRIKTQIKGESYKSAKDMYSLSRWKLKWWEMVEWVGISWKGNEGGGVISVTTIDKRKGRWGIHSFFSFCVCGSGIQRGES